MRRNQKELEKKGEREIKIIEKNQKLKIREYQFNLD